MGHIKKPSQRGHEISRYHGWIDSKIVFCWIQIKGVWFRFVRTQAIKSVCSVTWYYVPKTNNPSDLGSRGVHPNKKSTNLFKGSAWITSQKIIKIILGW